MPDKTTRRGVGGRWKDATWCRLMEDAESDHWAQIREKPVFMIAWRQQYWLDWITHWCWFSCMAYLASRIVALVGWEMIGCLLELALPCLNWRLSGHFVEGLAFRPFLWWVLSLFPIFWLLLSLVPILLIGYQFEPFSDYFGWFWGMGSNAELQCGMYVTMYSLHSWYTLILNLM